MFYEQYSKHCIFQTLHFKSQNLLFQHVSRRKSHKQRPMSASKNQRLNLFENEQPRVTSLDNSVSAKSVPKPIIVNSKPLQNTNSDLPKNLEVNSPDVKEIKEIETLISSERKKSIQDVLDIERDGERPPTATRRQLSNETKHYSVGSSSMATKDKKSSSGLGR